MCDRRSALITQPDLPGRQSGALIGSMSRGHCGKRTTAITVTPPSHHVVSPAGSSTTSYRDKSDQRTPWRSGAARGPSIACTSLPWAEAANRFHDHRGRASAVPTVVEARRRSTTSFINRRLSSAIFFLPTPGRHRQPDRAVLLPAAWRGAAGRRTVWRSSRRRSSGLSVQPGVPDCSASDHLRPGQCAHVGRGWWRRL